ncbi:DNA mismatch repair ATPase msh1, partial [Perkinsus olseni]
VSGNATPPSLSSLGEVQDGGKGRRPPPLIIVEDSAAEKPQSAASVSGGPSAWSDWSWETVLPEIELPERTGLEDTSAYDSILVRLRGRSAKLRKEADKVMGALRFMELDRGRSAARRQAACSERLRIWSAFFRRQLLEKGLAAELERLLKREGKEDHGLSTSFRRPEVVLRRLRLDNEGNMLDSYFHSERPRRRQEYRSTLEWLEGLVRLEAAAEASSEGRSALSRSRAILICIPAIVYVLDYLKGVIEAGGEVSFGMVKAVLSRVTDEELRESMELREMVEVMDEIVHPPVSSKEIVNYVLQARPGLVNGWIPRVSTILKHPTLRARLELEAAEAAAAAAKLKKEEEERKKNQGPSVLITELWERGLAEQGEEHERRSYYDVVILSMLCGGSGGLCFLSGQRLGPVATGVSEACRRWLQRLHRPAALQLVPMLSLDSNELGFLSPSRRAAGGSGSLLDFTLDGKRRRPEWIQLVRCGDFYETYGVDAVMLVNYCGLNAMAGRPRAGCRKDQIQMVLDSLTERGFSAAVYEEANESDFNKGPERKRKGKQRYLSQLVSPANPTYAGGGMVAQNTLADGEDMSFREDERLAAPRLALYEEPKSEGVDQETYTVVQVRVEAREYSLHPSLTPEGVMGLLAEASGWYRATALPLVVSSDIGLPPAWLPVEAAEAQPTSAFAVSLDPVECPTPDGVGGFVDAVLRKVSEEAFCLSLA